MFSTLDQERKRYVSRRERILNWVGGAGAAVLVVAGAVLAMLYI